MSCRIHQPDEIQAGAQMGAYEALNIAGAHHLAAARIVDAQALRLVAQPETARNSLYQGASLCGHGRDAGGILYREVGHGLAVNGE